MQIISPFASQMLDEMNGTRGGKGLRLVLRTAKMLGTKEWLQSRHLVPGELTFAFRRFHRKGQVWGSCPRLDRQAGGGAAAQRACSSLHLRLPRAPHPETLWVPGGGKGS